MNMTRAQMLAHIDTKAGAVRSCYITTVPGQEATYLIKAEQARQFAAVGFAGAAAGLVMAEANATGVTPKQAAQRILAENGVWTGLAATVETLRRTGKMAVTQAPSELAAWDAYQSTIQSLASMMP